jgi:hypothetical protein
MPGVPLAFASSVREPRYGLIARHGHEWDPNCHGWAFHNEVLERGRPAGQFDEATYRVMAIGEVVTAELVSGIVFRFAEAAGTTPAARQVVERLKDLNNLRPFLSVFRWLDWFAGQEARRFYPVLHAALRQSLEGVVESALARRWDELRTHVLPGSGDLVDHLEDIRRFGLGRNMEEFRGRVHAALPAVGLLTRGAADRYLDGAIRELRQEEDPAFQFILYGHTHVARQEYLTGELDGRGRIYINTGTYLPLITPRPGRTDLRLGQADDDDVRLRRGRGQGREGGRAVAGGVGRNSAEAVCDALVGRALALQGAQHPLEPLLHLLRDRPHRRVARELHGLDRVERQHHALVGLFIFIDHDVARQQQPDLRFGAQGLVGQRRIARAENQVVLHVLVEFHLQCGFHVDLGENSEALAGQRRSCPGDRVGEGGLQ